MGRNIVDSVYGANAVASESQFHEHATRHIGTCVSLYSFSFQVTAHSRSRPLFFPRSRSIAAARGL
eukprot:1327019-Rhodomonas_salina.2